jgi:hypothetical protein
MYVNAKMIPAETILGTGGTGMKDSSGGSGKNTKNREWLKL